MLMLLLQWKFFNREILIKFLSFTWLTYFCSLTEACGNLRHLAIYQIGLKLAKGPENVLGNRQMFTRGNRLLLDNTCCIIRGNCLKRGSFLLTSGGKGWSDLIDQKYFSFLDTLTRLWQVPLAKQRTCL